MTHAQQTAIIDRLFAHLSAGTTEHAGCEMDVAADVYLSPERYADEQRLLFRRLPLVLTLSSAVARPGDFVTCDEYGLPLLITRDQQGVVHVMLNACTHRGARLVGEAKGCDQKAFGCPYHGWTFGNDGELLHITRPECFPGTDKAERDLVTLPSEERHGLIWAVLDPKADIDVAAFLGEMDGPLADLQCADHASFAVDRWSNVENWKLSVEGFLEAYHAPYVHQEQADSFVGDLMIMDIFGPHQRLVVPRPSFRGLAALDRRHWRLRPHTTIVHFVFPSTFLVAQPDYIMFFRFCPGGPDKVTLVHDLLVAHAVNTEAWQARWTEIRQQGLVALRDDTTLFEGAHAALRAGTHFRFGTLEQGPAALHAAIDARLSPDDGQGSARS